jgi:hypothetical protein
MLSSQEAARRGRLGGYATSATHDPLAINEKARAIYKDSFRDGHGCAVCPRIDIPADLPEAERLRRAEALRSLHFGRLGRRSGKARAGR